MKRYGKYEGKVSWIVKRDGKYRRKASWIVKWYGKYGRKLWNDLENMEESQVENDKIGQIWKKGKLKSKKRFGNYGRNRSWIVKRFGKYRRKL